MSEAIRRAVRGVNSDGLKTMVLPQARAGPIFQHINMTANESKTVSISHLSTKDGREHTREVPCADLANDTDGLVTGVREFVVRRLDDLTLDLVGPAGIVLDGVDTERKIGGLCPAERLAYSHSDE